MELTNQQRVALHAAFLRKRPDDTFADDEYLEHLLAEAKEIDEQERAARVIAIDRTEPVTVKVTHLELEESVCHLCPNLPLYTYEMRRGSSLWRIPLCESCIQKKNRTLKALFPTTTRHLAVE